MGGEENARFSRLGYCGIPVKKNLGERDDDCKSSIERPSLHVINREWCIKTVA